MHGDAAKLMAAAVSVLIAASGASATPTTKVVATAGQMLGLAQEMVRRGEVRKAEAVLELLARDPDPDIRNEARFRHARILRGEKRYREAAVLLRRLLDEKPKAGPARLELAVVLQLLGDTNSALRELRAVQSAGLPPAVARLIDRYSQALRAQRPLGGSIEVSLAPDSNINRATRSDTLGTIFGDFQIAQEGKAKSGVGLSLNAQAFRRLPIGTRNSLLVRGSSSANLYRSSRFDDVVVDLAAGPELSLGRDRLQVEIGATQRWYGQKPYQRSARVAGIWSHPIGSRTLLRMTGLAALVDNRLNDLQDGKNYTGAVQLERAFTPTTGIAANLSLSREALKGPSYSTWSWRAGLSGWREMGRMTLTASAEIGRLHADERLVLFAQRREDRYRRFALGASFRQLQFKGFAPLLRFSVERNRSSIAFYDYRRTRTELGVVRAF